MSAKSRSRSCEKFNFATRRRENPGYLTKRFQEKSARLFLNGTIQNTRLCFNDPRNVGAKLWDDFRNLVYDHIDETFRRVSCMASAGEGVTGSIMTTSFGPLRNRI